MCGMFVTLSGFGQVNVKFADVVYKIFEQLDTSVSNDKIKVELKKSFGIIEKNGVLSINILGETLPTTITLKENGDVCFVTSYNKMDDIPIIEEQYANVIQDFVTKRYVKEFNLQESIYIIQRSNRHRYVLTSINDIMKSQFIMMLRNIPTQDDILLNTRIQIEKEYIKRERKKVIEKFIQDSLLTQEKYYNSVDDSLFVKYLRLYENERLPMVTWIKAPEHTATYPTNERKVSVNTLYYYDFVTKQSTSVSIGNSVAAGCENLMKRYKHLESGWLGVKWCADSNGIFYYRKYDLESKISAKLVYLKKKGEQVKCVGEVDNDVDIWLKENCKQDGKYFIRIINNNGLLVIQDVTAKSTVFKEFAPLCIGTIKKALNHK